MYSVSLWFKAFMLFAVKENKEQMLNVYRKNDNCLLMVAMETGAMQEPAPGKEIAKGQPCRQLPADGHTLISGSNFLSGGSRNN